MDKKLIVLTIILIFAAVISLISASYLWFSSDYNIPLESAEMIAIPLNLDVEMELDPAQQSYMGQTGKNAQLDSPYNAAFNVSMSCNSDDDYNKNLKLGINSVRIEMWNYVEADGETPEQNASNLTEAEVQADFTYRLSYGGNIYVPDSEGYMYCINGGYTEYLALSTGDSIDYVLTLIYLGESSYRLWQQARYDEYEEFGYCSPDYMNAHFIFTVNFELGEANQAYDDKLAFNIKDDNFVPKSGSLLSNLHKLEYTPHIEPFDGEPGFNKVMKAYIDGVTIIKADNSEVTLTPEEIDANFTLRVYHNDIRYSPSTDSVYKDYIQNTYSLNVIYLKLATDTVSDIDLDVVCQDETDYYHMERGLAGYPLTNFAYSTTEYEDALILYDIKVEMYDEPVAATSYAFENDITIGVNNSSATAYAGQTGSSLANTYTFDTALTLTPGTENNMRITISKVYIITEEGAINELGASQIDGNFTLRLTYGSNEYAPFEYNAIYRLREDFMYYKDGFIPNFLELDNDVPANVTLTMVFQDKDDYLSLEGGGSQSTAFAYTVADYHNATFCFDVRIEIRNKDDFNN